MSTTSPPRPELDREGDEWNPAEQKPLWHRIIFGTKPFEVVHTRRRLRLSLIFTMVVFSLLAARLIDLQVVAGPATAAQALDGRLVSVTDPAIRGSILDSNGVVLAQTVPARDVTVDPWKVDDPQDYAAKYSSVTGMPVNDVLKALERKTNADGTKQRFAYVQRHIKVDLWDQVKKLNLPATFPEVSSVREYPNGALAANLIGATNGDGDGIAGYELALNDQLKGTDGKRTYERSGTGAEIPTGNESGTSATAGSTVQLSINRDLQFVAQQAVNTRRKEVKADSIVAVVLDVKTGRILALAQSPTSDPNSPKRTSQGLRNLAVEQEFEPGSTAKVMTVAAAVNEGKVDPTTPFDIPNRLVRGGFPFKDDVDHHGYKMTTAGVLAKSSNIGTIQIAERIGAAKLDSYLQAFGIGQPSGLNFPAENPGYLPSLDKWNPQTFSNIAYGQAFSVNAIQAASVFATIANNGTRVTPRLIDSITSPDGQTTEAPASSSTQVVTEQTAKTMISMMEEVVSKRGTAPQAAVPGYRVAGKTGTAQLVNEDGSGYGSRYVASFIGLAPADNPRLAIAVIARNPTKTRFGGETSGPVFSTIMSSALQMMQIPPSETKAPSLKLRAPGSSKGGPWNL